MHSTLLEFQETTLPGDPAPGQVLTVLKEIWSFKGRLEDLAKKSAGRALSFEEIFGTIFGPGEDPNAKIERELQEINRKLDLVLEGIKQIQLGLLGMGVLAVYIDIGDSVFLIEKYTEELRKYLGKDQATQNARKDFIDKLLGVRSEREGVYFCAQKILKLGPKKSPLLLDLMFPYVSHDAKPENAFEKYASGVAVFRFIVDILLKALVLELFAASAAPQASMVEGMEKVVKKYREWFRSTIDNSFLPFAEQMAALQFQAEFFGGNSTTLDYNKPFPKWNAPANSILRNADELVARVMGRSKSLTLRVVPFVPPITKEKISSQQSGGGVQAGKDYWQYKPTPSDGPTRDKVLSTIWETRTTFFGLSVGSRPLLMPEHVSRGDVSLPSIASIPVGLRETALPIIRMEYNCDSVGAGPQKIALRIGNTQAASQLKPFSTIWERFYEEGGKRFPGTNQEFKHSLVEVFDQAKQGVFQLSDGGHLSPVLLTYSYDKFGDTVVLGEHAGA